MLIGHFAVGLAARKVAPRAPMWLLLPAPQLLDLVWPFFFFAGVERFEMDPAAGGFLALKLQHVPWSHGLVSSLGWALLLAVPYYLWRRDGRGAVVLGALVVRHWVLDWVTHTPDLPLFFGEDRHGLGLWRSTAGTVVVEVAMLASAVWLYVKSARPGSKSQWWALGSFLAVISLVYLGSVAGPPPGSSVAVASAGLALWLAPLWGWWMERGRTASG